MKIKVIDAALSSADESYINNIAASYRKNKISYDEAESQLKERFGTNVRYSISVCNTSAKGSFCPVCKKTGLNSRLGNEKNPGYHCRICGYSARTWQPPITRRLKKRIKMLVLDESQAVKNRSALRSRYALSLRPKYRYLTSGTPATADLGKDIYYQLEWLFGKGVMFPSLELGSSFFRQELCIREPFPCLFPPSQLRADKEIWTDQGKTRTMTTKTSRAGDHQKARDELTDQSNAWLLCLDKPHLVGPRSMHEAGMVRPHGDLPRNRAMAGRSCSESRPSPRVRGCRDRHVQMCPDRRSIRTRTAVLSAGRQPAERAEGPTRPVRANSIERRTRS